MNYQVSKCFIEQQKISVNNEADKPILCRVDVNRRLFKMIYLEPQSSAELIYDMPEEIVEVRISEL